MKALFKRKRKKDEMRHETHYASRPDEQMKDQTIENLVSERLGKSRREILDLIKILKSF